jgi:redox-sensitive bicupin YhaK (pirin superfamily)
MKRRDFLQSLFAIIPVAVSAGSWYNFQTINKQTAMSKRVIKKSELQFTKDFPGLEGVNMMASAFPIEPVLVFTEFRMNQPVFGPHPHAGVSVMTYMLPDSKQGFINRDSLGDFSYIEPGGMHISQAGSGMFHDEFPRERGVDTHGFQIWFNHAEENRWVTPKSMHATSAQIKEVVTEDYTLRIVHGKYKEWSAPYQMVTNVNLFHIFLAPGKSIKLEAGEMAFLYGLHGTGKVDHTDISGQTLINFSKEGNEVTVEAGDKGFECMFATATPINEPLVYGGPFVMTTREQMRKTQQRLASGEMGHLAPYRPN